MRDPRGRIYVVGAPMGTLIICRCASSAVRPPFSRSRRAAFGKYGLAEFHVPRVSPSAHARVCTYTRAHDIYGETRDRCVLDVRQRRHRNAYCDLWYRGIINLPCGRTIISVSLATLFYLPFFLLCLCYFFKSISLVLFVVCRDN